MTRTPPCATAVALILCLAAPAAAQEVEHPATRSEAAWNAADMMRGDVLGPVQVASFMTLAWHAAMANLCAELRLDHALFGAAYAGLEHADMASLSEEEHAYFNHHLAVNFGVAVGIMLSELASDPDRIAERCAAAADLAASAENESYFSTAARGADGAAGSE